MKRSQSRNKQNLLKQKNTKKKSLPKNILPKRKELLQVQNPYIQGLNDLIHQYLLKNGLKNTLAQFQKELNSKQKNVKIILQNQMFEALQNGNSEVFFSKFYKYTPKTTRKTNNWVLTMQFYLRVYFLIFPLNPNCSQNIGSMNKKQIQRFRNFIEYNGNQLAKKSELINFYGLPYMQNPRQNKYFKFLFQQEWKESLFKRFREFLNNLYQNGISKLLMIYRDYIQKQNQNIEQENQFKIKQQIKSQQDQIYQKYQSEIDKLNSNIRSKDQLLKQYKFNYIESQKVWLTYVLEVTNISNQLLHILENRDQYPLQLEHKIKPIKKRIGQFIKLGNQSIEDLDQNLSVFQNSHVNLKIEKQINLDYEKISKNVDQKEVLNLLIYKITTTQGMYPKRYVIVSIFHYHIIQFIILKKQMKNIQQFYYLLKAITQDYYGRIHLSEIEEIIYLLIQKYFQIDHIQSLTILSRLALQKKVIQIIDKSNFGTRIIQKLRTQHQDLPQNVLELLTSFLFPLSIYCKSIVKYSQSLLLVFSNLIQCNNEQIQINLLKAFYILVDHKVIKQGIKNVQIIGERSQNIEKGWKLVRDKVIEQDYQQMVIDIDNLASDPYSDMQLKIPNQILQKYTLPQKIENQKVKLKVFSSLEAKNKSKPRTPQIKINIQAKEIQKQSMKPATPQIGQRAIIGVQGKQQMQIGKIGKRTYQRGSEYEKGFKPKPRIVRTPPNKKRQR